MWDEQGWMLGGFLSVVFPPTSSLVKGMGGRQQTDSRGGNWVGGLSGLLLAPAPRRIGTIQLGGGGHQIRLSMC